jgi:hypothetical protein
LAFSVGADRRRLLLGLGEDLISRPSFGVGAAPGALERGLGLQPSSLDDLRLLGFLGRHGSFALRKLGTLVRERPADVGACETTG